MTPATEPPPTSAANAWPRRWATVGRRVGAEVLDLVLPPRCLRCGQVVAGADGLCGECWRQTRLIDEPLCNRCGHPLAHAMGGAAFCAACERQKLPVDRARAALVYDTVGRDLVLSFKHGGRIDGVRLLARWLAEAGRPLLAEADLVVPVPLHRWRMLGRGFNQSAMLAQRLPLRPGARCVLDLLVKRRATRSQQGLGGKARAANVTADAFALRPGGPPVTGLRVLLVDDVLTTGSTLAACAAVLRQAGAVGVDGLTLARVVRDGALLISHP